MDHLLFQTIAAAESLSDVLSLQLIDIPTVTEQDTRLALREALQARREVLKAKALSEGRFYLPSALQTN